MPSTTPPSEAAQAELVLSWEDVHSMAIALANDIHANMGTSISMVPAQPMVAIAIGGGGFVPAAIVWRELCKKEPYFCRPAYLFSGGLSSYEENKTRTEKGVWDVELPKVIAQLVHGRTVLLLDDIYDTGQTIRLFRRALQPAGPLEIATATLVAKRTSEGNGKLLTRTMVFPNTWVHFPWEEAFQKVDTVDFTPPAYYYETPGHPMYGPCRRVWVILQQLGITREVETIYHGDQGVTWCQRLEDYLREGISEAEASALVVSLLLSWSCGSTVPAT